MDKIAAELRRLPIEGFIWLHVRSTNTKNNAEIHEQFRAFAKSECDDNYTIAIKTLMGGYNVSTKCAELESALLEVKDELEQLKIKIKQLEDRSAEPQEDSGTF